MVNWDKTTSFRGSYISPVHSISNNLDKYLASIKLEHQIPHLDKGNVEYFFRVSYDTIEWSDWKQFYETSYDLLNDYKLDSLYFQYKLSITAKEETTKPYVNKVSFELSPYVYIENNGDLETLPKLWIKKVNGKGTIALKNQTTGQTLELKDLNNSEEIYIDCENEEIVSSNQSSGVYRYDSHNDEYLVLARGDNYITSDGDYNLDIRFKGKLLQE